MSKFVPEHEYDVFSEIYPDDVQAPSVEEAEEQQAEFDHLRESTREALGILATADTTDTPVRYLNLAHMPKFSSRADDVTTLRPALMVEKVRFTSK